MVVTGGVDCFNDIFMYMCFSKTPALSPTGDAKSFDRKADGTILGEGLGMLVLKRLDDAEKDGDRIYAVLKGVGSSSDGRGKAIYAPSAEGQTKALREAYRVADVAPETIGLVEAHRTGTTVRDEAEVAALSEVFGKGEEPWCALGSVKSMIGHTKAAAGAAGMIKAALALHHKVFPPTIKVTDPIASLADGLGPFYVSSEKRPWLKKGHPRRAAVSALGFGGSNFHAVLEEYSPEKTETDWDGTAQIAAFSGADEAAIKQSLAAWSAELSWNDVRLKAYESRSSFRASSPCRLVLVLEKSQDLKKVVASALSNLDSSAGKSSWSSPEGIFFGRGKPGKLACLFPGQGSQYVGMGRDLACQFPAAFDVLSDADAALAGTGLAGLIHPRPAFTETGKSSHESALRQTQAAQPALGAVGLAAFRVLQDFGLSPDMVAGHSYGELAALCAAGAFDAAALWKLSALRGELMAEGDGGRGGMLAVQAEVAQIEAVIAEEKLELVLANKHAPQQ
jgi:acyl transferase domain-containing protein